MTGLLSALILVVALMGYPVTPVTGTATWYCHPNRSTCTRGYHWTGPYAAAGPALRVGNWRGRWVTVRANGRAIRVKLVDFCRCPGRLLDLYGSQFSRLAPRSGGVLRVVVTW